MKIDESTSWPLWVERSWWTIPCSPRVGPVKDWQGEWWIFSEQIWKNNKPQLSYSWFMLIWLDDLEWSWKMLGSIWLRYWQNIMKHPSFLSSNLTWVCFHSAKYHTKVLPDHYLCCFIASSWPLKMSSTTTTRRWCTHGWHWRSTPWRNHTAIGSCLKVMFFRSKVNFYIF